MAKPIKLLAAALVALVATSTVASALDIQSGGQPKLRATKIQLGIKSPANNVCPGNASFNVWVFSNKPGTVPILIVRKNGGVSGPYNVETTKGANGQNMGTYVQNLNIQTAIDTEYKIVTSISDASSNWVKLKADC